MKEDTCIICMDNVVLVQFIPCEHFIVCEKCVHLLESNKCPLCRAIVEEVGYNNFAKEDSSFDKDEANILCNEQVDCNPSREDVVSLPLKLIQEQRHLIEDLVKSFTFHVVICGSKEKDIVSLSLSLQQMYPISSEYNFMQRIVDQLCCTETFLWFLSQSQETCALFHQGQFKSVLEHLCPNLSIYIPNMEMNCYPIRLDTITFSQLAECAPTDCSLFADVFVLCIDARSRDSFWQTLVVDEHIRKWKRRQNRIWLVQHYDAVECQYRPNSVQRAQVEYIYNEMRPCERPVDILFMNSEGLFKIWLRELAFQMLAAAKGVRYLCKLQQENYSICPCM